MVYEICKVILSRGLFRSVPPDIFIQLPIHSMSIWMVFKIIIVHIPYNWCGMQFILNGCGKYRISHLLYISTCTVTVICTVFEVSQLTRDNIINSWLMCCFVYSEWVYVLK